MYTTLLVSLVGSTFLSTTAAVVVDGYLSESCTGERLYKYDVTSIQNCIDVSKYIPASSIAIGQFYAGQSVFLFSDVDCQAQIYSAEDDICYTAPNDNVKAITVGQAIS